MTFNPSDVFRANGNRDDVRQIEAVNMVNLRVGATHDIAMDFGPLLNSSQTIATVLSLQEWNTPTPVSVAGTTAIVNNDRTSQPSSMVSWSVSDAFLGVDPKVRVTIATNDGRIRAMNGTICTES